MCFENGSAFTLRDFACEKFCRARKNSVARWGELNFQLYVSFLIAI